MKEGKPAKVIQTPLELVWEKMPLILLSFISSAVTIKAQLLGGGITSTETFPFTTRLANASVAYFKYLNKTIWPSHLSVFYPHPGDSIPVWQPVLCALLLMGITTVVISGRKRLPYLPVGWLWFLGTLVPVIGLVQVGRQAMADRYAYVPLIGLFIVTVWGISDCSARVFKSSSWPVGIAACSTVALALSTSHQLSYWRNAETLFRQALTTTKDNYIAYDALGMTLYEKGEVDKAIPCFAKALEIQSGYMNARKNLASAEHNRGVAFALVGKQDEAIACYRRALEIQPYNAEFHYNLGLAMQAKGKSQQATFHFAEAVRIQPNHFKAHKDLGSLFALQGRPNEAVTHYLKATEIHPDPETYYNLGEVFMHQGRASEAAQYFSRALKLKPDYKEARQSLNNLLGRGVPTGSAQ